MAAKSTGKISARIGSSQRTTSNAIAMRANHESGASNSAAGIAQAICTMWTYGPPSIAVATGNKT